MGRGKSIAAYRLEKHKEAAELLENVPTGTFNERLLQNKEVFFDVGNGRIVRARPVRPKPLEDP